MYSIYDSLLRKYVNNGRVNNKGFKASAEELDTYLGDLGSVSERDYANPLGINCLQQKNQLK
ncbi:MAG: hypothetical protein ACREOW_02445 [Thermodesulfobacteriota bacterium]